MRLQRLTGTAVAAGSAYTAQAKDFGKIILLDTLSGSVVTLPPATGSGGRIKVFEKIAATSNSHKIQVANSNDVMAGNVALTIAAGGAASAFATVAASDTITLNRTTTGGASNGGWFEFEDVAPNLWAVKGVANASATPATPFSAAV